MLLDPRCLNQQRHPVLQSGVSLQIVPAIYAQTAQPSRSDLYEETCPLVLPLLDEMANLSNGVMVFCKSWKNVPIMHIASQYHFQLLFTYISINNKL